MSPGTGPSARPPNISESPRDQAVRGAISAAREVAGRHPEWPPALGPVSVAQYCLESAYGTRMSGANNPFGIKARLAEPATERSTWEVINGRRVEIVARFRDFRSLSHAFDEHGRLLCERKRQDGQLIYRKALVHRDDPFAFAAALTGVYATDPQYGEKLAKILRLVVLPLWTRSP